MNCFAGDTTEMHDVPPGGNCGEIWRSGLPLDGDAEIETYTLGIHREWWPLLAHWF